MSIQQLTWLLLIAAAAVAGACGEAQSSMNPVAPSAVVAGAQRQDASSASTEVTTTAGPKPGNGKGNGNGNGNGRGSQPTVPSVPTVPGNTTPTAPTNATPTVVVGKLEIEGLIAARSADSITVNGNVVKVPATTPVRHGNRVYSLADLRVGDRVYVRANRLAPVSPSPSELSALTLEATDVKLQNPGDAVDEEDDEDEDEGDDPVTPPSSGTTRVRPKGKSTRFARRRPFPGPPTAAS